MGHIEGEDLVRVQYTVARVNMLLVTGIRDWIPVGQVEMIRAATDDLCEIIDIIEKAQNDPEAPKDFDTHSQEALLAVAELPGH